MYQICGEKKQLFTAYLTYFSVFSLTRFRDGLDIIRLERPGERPIPSWVVLKHTITNGDGLDIDIFWLGGLDVDTFQLGRFWKRQLMSQNRHILSRMVWIKNRSVWDGLVIESIQLGRSGYENFSSKIDLFLRENHFSNCIILWFHNFQTHKTSSKFAKAV